MTDRELLYMYIPVIDFISSILGDSVEVVLHDVAHPENSVIAIHNGHLSGRDIGAPLTDLALDIIYKNQYKSQNFIANYQAKSNGKTFLSSSFFIKNAKGKLIGMICVNKDTGNAKDCVVALNKLLTSLNMGDFLTDNSDAAVQENLDLPMDSLASSIVKRTVSSYHIPPERMTREEKRKIVCELDEQGISKIKGGVSEIARSLELSESTVYRYISQK